MRCIRYLVRVAIVLLVFCAFERLVTATPLLDEPTKQYKTSIIRLISAQWYKLFYAQSKNILVGKLHVHASVARDGTLQVESIEPDKPDDVLCKVTLQALRQVRLPPIPEDVAVGKPFTLDLTFNAE